MKLRIGILLICQSLISSVSAQETFIKAGFLINTEAASISRNQIIHINNGRIAAIGTDLEIPSNSNVVDMSNSYVMPGLIDAHTHLCMTVRSERDNGNYYYTTLNDPNAARAIDGVVNAKDTLHSGFTTVRDLGAEGRYACTYVRYAILRGEIEGPTMITAGRILAPFGGQFRLQPDKPYLAEPEYYIADTHDEMLKGIRENIHFGAGVIKIVVDDQRYIYSVEDIQFMKNEAEKSGLKIAAHAFSPSGVHNAAAAGVDSIEHLTLADPADFPLMKKNNVTAVFTPLPVEYFSGSMPLSEAQRIYQSGVNGLIAAHETGVSLAFGSDVLENVFENRGKTALSVIDAYVDADIPPSEILQAMTINAAILLGIDGLRGDIKKGMVADIVATEENPLENIQALKNVTFVMKNGKIIK